MSDTGRTNPRCSFATCGNVIYGLGDYTPGFAKLMPGTRDIHPDVHIWVGSAQDWVTVPEDALQYDEQPTDIDELLRLVAENRAKAAEKATCTGCCADRRHRQFASNEEETPWPAFPS